MASFNPAVTSTGDPVANSQPTGGISSGVGSGGETMPTQTTLTSVTNHASSGLQKGEIIGIALGAISALAAIIGVGIRWRQLHMAKKQASGSQRPIPSSSRDSMSHNHDDAMHKVKQVSNS